MHTHITPIFPENISEYAPWVAEHGLLQPYGKCQCGCGQTTKPSDRNRPLENNAKGHPRRFANGHRMFSQSPEETFWNYVAPGPKDECWLWGGSVSSRGYGKFNLRGVTYSAHRFSYEIHHGPLSKGELACHTCDTPSCVNPNHLFAGTSLANMKDKMDKGRHRWSKGEESTNTHLTDEDVREIRELSKQGITQREIGERFGIGQGSVHRIVHFKRWAHVT